MPEPAGFTWEQLRGMDFDKVALERHRIIVDERSNEQQMTRGPKIVLLREGLCTDDTSDDSGGIKPGWWLLAIGISCELWFLIARVI